MLYIPPNVGNVYCLDTYKMISAVTEVDTKLNTITTLDLPIRVVQGVGAVYSVFKCKSIEVAMSVHGVPILFNISGMVKV